MGFLSLLVAGIFVGILAQKWKGRTGAIWGIVTVLLGIPWWLFGSAAVIINELQGLEQEVGTIAMDITTFSFIGGPVFVVMALIVATLPNKKPTETSNQ